MRHTLAPRRGMASGRGLSNGRVRAAVPSGVRRYALPLARPRKLNGSE